MAPDFEAISADDAYVQEWYPNFWVMDDHRWALYAWEMIREKRNRSAQYSLVHADYHFDGCYDIEDGALLALKGSEAIRNVVAENSNIRKDSFIAPAVVRGMFSELHFFCPQTDTELGIDADILKRGKCLQYFYATIEELAKARFSAPVIFDICLDLFNRSDKWEVGDLWEDNLVLDSLNAVSALIREAEAVTCSLSFGYSGSAADTRHLARLCIPHLMRVRGLTIA